MVARLEAESMKGKSFWSLGYQLDEPDNAVKTQKVVDKFGLGVDFEVVVAKKSQLQIDYDSPIIPQQFHKILWNLTKIFCPNGETLIWAARRSKSGNLHVTVDLPVEISDTERIAWQAIFGSDPIREVMSLMAVKHGIANPTLLIEKRDAELVTTGIKTLEIPKGRKFRDTSTASD